MKFNKKTVQKIGLGALVMGAALLIGNVAMASDTGAWTSLSVSGKLSDSLTLNVGEELRFGDITDPSLVRQHTDIGVTSKVSDLVNGIGQVVHYAKLVHLCVERILVHRGQPFGFTIHPVAHKQRCRLT